jgi:hypothetical protein
MRKRRLLLIGLGLGLGLALFLATAMAPIAWIEASCMETPVDDSATYSPILAPEHRRPETNTYVTYPEWLIVHVYEDYAAVAREEGESAFPYFSSIGRYWSNLCVMTRHASARGFITSDSKAMLYTIGVSFSIEMALKGVYEKTVGWLTETIGGETASPEDRFARAVADDYALFLVQAPWYAYPFNEKLKAFWREVPWGEGNVIRKLERRTSLSLEFGFKALYARAIGALAGMAPAPLQIRSVVRGWNASGVHEADIKTFEALAGGLQIIETPRYRDFTHIVRRLSMRGVDIVEIAGNDEVFITILLPTNVPLLHGQSLITAPIAARPGWHREGLLVKVVDLGPLVRRLASIGGELEHVYEY